MVSEIPQPSKNYIFLKKVEPFTKEGDSPVNYIELTVSGTVPIRAHSPYFEVRLFTETTTLMWRNGRRARLKTSSFWGVGSSPIMSKTEVVTEWLKW